MIQDGQLLNYVGGKWQRSRTGEFAGVRNPATAETIVRVPLSSRAQRLEYSGKNRKGRTAHDRLGSLQFTVFAPNRKHWQVKLKNIHGE